MRIPSLAAVRAELARREFSRFLGWSTPSWSWQWPHLAKMQEVLQALADDDIQNALFMVPPQHGKTEQNTIRFSCWLLHRDLSTRVAMAAYNQELANRFSRSARRLATEIGIPLIGDRAAVQEWQTDQGGGVRAVGIGAGLTGNPVDIGIIDDPIKDREEAESQKVRDSHWEWYTDVWMTRNPRHQVMTLTPWHHDGLQARILNSPQAKRWTVIQLPALAIEGDPLGRQPGEALCPDRVTREELESRRAMNPYTFEALYQCNPTPREGSLFKVSMLRFVEAHEVPVGLPTVRVWDLAATSGGGDYTAGVKMTGPDAEGTFYVVDVVRGQWDATERNRVIRATAEQDGPLVRSGVPQDPGAAGKEVVAAMRRLLAGFAVYDETETGSKELRAEPLAAQVGGGNIAVVRSHWTSDLVEEFRTFPLGKHDDQVDAAARAFNSLARKVEVYFA